MSREYQVAVRFDADTDEEAVSIAADIEQTLSGRDIVAYFGQGDYVLPVFPHQVRTDRVRQVNP